MVVSTCPPPIPFAMKRLLASLVFAALASVAYADWSADGWSGPVTDDWSNYGTLPNLKTLIDTEDFRTGESNVVRRFQILSTYYGGGGVDTNHAVRMMLFSYLPTDKVDAQKFRVLTGDGDAKRVALAVKGVLRYGQEMFVEKNLTESMRVNALYILFLSFGSVENLNLADTAYGEDVFSTAGGSLDTMRLVRRRIIEAATLWNKQKLAAEGKPFVGAGRLVEANAVVASCNTGSNWITALQGVGVTVDAQAVAQVGALAQQIKADILNGGVMNRPRRTLLEVYLGTQGYNDFLTAYSSK